MVTRKSAQRETKDPQRLLLAVGLMRSKKIAKWNAGVWGDESQRAVLIAEHGAALEPASARRGPH